MGKKDNKKKGKGAEKTALKTAKKAQSKLKKELAAKGEEDIETLIASFVKSDRQKERIGEDLVEPPSPRSGCSLLVNPEKDLLYLFAGSYYNGNKTFMYNDFFTYNIKKNNWLKLATPVSPPPRCSQQAVIVAQGGGQIWMFGGEFASPTLSQFYHYKDLWCLHLTEKRWEKVDAPGGPSSRSGHRMITNGKELFIFGGFHETLSDARYFNDVYRFTISERKWTKIEAINQGPSPRSGVQMSWLENKILIYGGYAKEKSGKEAEKGLTYSDMYYLTQDKNTEKWKWSTVKQGGARPSPRSGMAIVTGTSNKAYLFGGVCDEEEDDEAIKSVFKNDLFLLETDKGLWRELDLRQDRPKTSDEVMEEAPIEDLHIEEQEEVKSDGIFTVKISTAPTTSGGPDSTTSNQNSEAQEKKFVPHPRMSSCLAIKHGILYLFGGIYESGDKQFTFRDMHSINLHKLDQWKTLVPLNEQELEWFDSESESGSEEEDDDMETDEEDSDD